MEKKEKFSILDENEVGLSFSDQPDSLISNDAKNALKSLGYKTNQISKAFSEISKDGKAIDKLEDIIREALKKM